MKKILGRKKRIDLHTHTSNSTGEELPSELVENAKKEGISILAVTDHNKFTFTECKQVDEMMIVPGIEFSATYKLPSQNDTTEIHIVGIFPNGVKERDFADILEGIERGKEEYLMAILEDLETRGIHITLEEVYGVERKGKDIGRNQIAQVLVNKKIEEDMEAALDHQIGNFSPYYIPSTRYIPYASMKNIVKRIQACGGLPCLAHPCGYGMTEEEVEQLIGDFKQAAGEVAAMEVYYERYLKDSVCMNFLHKMQMKYDLLASCGSDRHGTGQTFATGGDVELFEKMLTKLKNTHW